MTKKELVEKLGLYKDDNQIIVRLARGPNRYTIENVEKSPYDDPVIHVYLDTGDKK